MRSLLSAVPSGFRLRVSQLLPGQSALSAPADFHARAPDLSQETLARQTLQLQTLQLESLHTQFLRRLLGIHSHTHNLIALAESGRYPLAVHWQRQVDRFRQRILNTKLQLQREPLLWAMYDDAFPALYCSRSPAPCCALQAHGSAETAPSKERHEQRFRDCQAVPVATYMQMRGPSTAYAMQPYLTRVRGFRLRRAYTSIRCSSHQSRVQIGR